MKKSLLLLLILLIPFLALAQTADDYFNKGATKAEKGDYTGAIQNIDKSFAILELTHGASIKEVRKVYEFAK